MMISEGIGVFSNPGIDSFKSMREFIYRNKKPGVRIQNLEEEKSCY
jgi:hypothetical protein